MTAITAYMFKSVIQDMDTHKAGAVKNGSLNRGKK